MKISYMKIRGSKMVVCDGTTTLSLLITERASKLEYSETKLTITYTYINEMILKWRAVDEGVKGFLHGELE